MPLTTKKPTSHLAWSVALTVFVLGLTPVWIVAAQSRDVSEFVLRVMNGWQPILMVVVFVAAFALLLVAAITRNRKFPRF